ncbi:hypothetical protein Glove_13g281 [Diversispora epigaea]|uniref:Peptidase S8/S53 domain-containing protein n=1 Tax=Diversispora epigaea TaxID=1348612 RepID=A0A397JU07_9GLOM|nr:hypothetical protein Glove_13g281 [Diversispora epigaea]
MIIIIIYKLIIVVLGTHKEFEGPTSFLGAFCDGCADTDGNGHGSYVSGIVGGKTFDVAKNVDIVGVKVLNSQGSGKLADIINSFSFVLDDVISKKNNAIL